MTTHWRHVWRITWWGRDGQLDAWADDEPEAERFAEKVRRNNPTTAHTVIVYRVDVEASA